MEEWPSLVRIGLAGLGLWLAARELVPFLKKQLGRGPASPAPPDRPESRLYRVERARMWCLTAAVGFAVPAVAAVLLAGPVWVAVGSFGICVAAAVGYVILSGVLGWLEGRTVKR